MANIKSQHKRIVTNEQRRQRNIAVRSRVKTLVKTADAAAPNKPAEEAERELKAALSSIDRACSKGIIPPNQAARRKSSLMQRSNRARQANAG